jgi:hypothetical protein
MAPKNDLICQLPARVFAFLALFSRDGDGLGGDVCCNRVEVHAECPYGVALECNEWSVVKVVTEFRWRWIGRRCGYKAINDR